jgi:hypothetical protein
VIQGKLRITFYTKTGKAFDSVVLEKGDTIIQMSLAHGLEVLEDAKFLEVKQGPYPGTKTTKIAPTAAQKRAS